MSEQPTWGKDQYESEQEFLRAKAEERQEKRQELITGMQEVLKDMGDRDKPNQKTKKAQNEILNRLPGDFFENLKGHVIAHPYEQAIYGKKESLTKEYIKKLIAGELFEELVRADSNIARRKETKRATALRQVMHLPERYDLGDEVSHPFRNPDLAVINDEGQIVGWVECKTGRLNHRAEQQLSNSSQGFRTNFRKVLGLIRQIPDRDLSQKGLEVFAGEKNKQTLRLAEKPEMILAVPRGTFRDNYKSLMGVDVENPDSLQQTLEQQYEVKESPFSREELRVLTDFLTDKLFPEKEN